MKLVIMDSVSPDAEEFTHYMKTPATTVFFSNCTSDGLDTLLNASGFEQVKHMTLFYFKRVDNFILIIKIESGHIKEKYFVHYTEENLSYIRETKGYDNSFESFHNDEKRNYTLYPEGVEKPFFEHFVVRENYGNPILTRTDVGFKYINNRFLIASLYEKHKKQINICYDDYSKDPECVLADFIGFNGKEVIDLKLLNTKNGKKISLLDHKDVFNVSDVTIENFHLFWERYTPEQTTLLAMLLI